jgi:hypothetical protein
MTKTILANYEAPCPFHGRAQVGGLELTEAPKARNVVVRPAASPTGRPLLPTEAPLRRGFFSSAHQRKEGGRSRRPDPPLLTTGRDLPSALASARMTVTTPIKKLSTARAAVSADIPRRRRFGCAPVADRASSARARHPAYRCSRQSECARGGGPDRIVVRAWYRGRRYHGIPLGVFP